ncbi:MAG TPA: alkaline phosphatase [Bacillales bacterium]
MVKHSVTKKGIMVFFALALAFMALATGMFNNADAKGYHGPKIKNVILMIGDGMGPAYLTAYRYLKDDPSTPRMEPTAFDPYLVGMASTYSYDKQEAITDSAAAATAMSAGVKTYNGAIAVNMDRQPVETVLEQAKKNGKATGLVTTTQINHATPAAFGAHDVERHHYNAIADDYYDDLINGQHKIDVMLGGGQKFFKRDDRNLVKAFKEDGYSYVTTRKELMNDNNEQVLGLFAEVELPKMIDRPDSVPSLKEMTTSALDRLSQDKDGFFLMVEGGQIDWAGHANDIVGAMSEVKDFEKAFKAALEFAKEDGHTLVVVTADHSTGGLTIGADGKYDWNPEPIKKAERTPQFMAEQIANGAPVKETLDQYIEFDLTQEEIQSVKAAENQLDENPNAVHDAINKIFTERTNTGWTTHGHTGVDVPVYAYGPAAEMFAGRIENTKIAKNIFDILNNGKHHDDDDEGEGYEED